MDLKAQEFQQDKEAALLASSLRSGPRAQTLPEKQVVVISGTPAGGFAVIGPFDGYTNAAETWADAYIGAFDWWVVQLQEPEGF
ncbi:MAG: hypothetical protein AMS18_00335 [Gemmatimonas sp. SG8_17]|nr:MAG: hypothetical protein AMS18_00335 [Gemmatimonas sp. SG8_17]